VKRNRSANVGNEVIQREGIRKRDKTKNTVGSKDENEEMKGRRGTKEEKEGIRTSQRHSQIFSTPKPVVAKRTGTAALYVTRLPYTGIPPVCLSLQYQTQISG
jgi:hypothetical protein